MPGPGGPVNDLIMQLMAEAGHTMGARASPGLGNRMYRINSGHPDLAPGKFDHLPARNVVPGPGSNPPISRDPWFDDVKVPYDDNKPRYIWATNPAGKEVRLDGPFTNEEELLKALNEISRRNPKIKISVRTDE